MRKCEGLGGRVPDAYAVQMNFSSLMPDTLDLWSGYGFSYSLDNGAGIKGMRDDYEAIAKAHAEQDAARRKQKNDLRVRYLAALSRKDYNSAKWIVSQYQQNGWVPSELGVGADQLAAASEEEVARFQQAGGME